MAISFLRALILYIVVIFSVRLMGKRQLGELQPSELVITILISNIATLPLEDLNIPLLMGIVPILSLVCFEVLMSWGTLKCRKLRKVVSGSPKIIVRGGEIDQHVLRELRFSVDDLMTAMRGAGIFDLSEVQFAVVETTGSISVYQTAAARPVTNQDLQGSTETGDPPTLLISDGEVLQAGLRAAGLDPAWLHGCLAGRGLSADQVFMMTAKSKQDFEIIEKKKESA